MKKRGLFSLNIEAEKYGRGAVQTVIIMAVKGDVHDMVKILCVSLQ